MQAEKIAAIHGAAQVQLESGTIESIDESAYRIQGHDGHYSAIRAFSCMVEPIEEDIVLFSIDESLQCHILSIIERPHSKTSNLTFPGDVTFNVSQGQLNVQGQHGLNIVSEQTISMVSEEYSLTTKKALFSVESLSAIGTKLISKIRHIQTIADSVETTADYLLQKLNNSFRQIEGVDQTRSRDMIYTVKNLFSMRSKQAAILAKKDIKMDAERIHMG